MLLLTSVPSFLCLLQLTHLVTSVIFVLCGSLILMTPSSTVES